MGMPLPDQREQSGNPVSIVRSDPKLPTFLFNFFSYAPVRVSRLVVLIQARRFLFGRAR